MRTILADLKAEMVSLRSDLQRNRRVVHCRLRIYFEAPLR